MPSVRYIKEKRRRASEKSRLGVEAREKKRIQQGRDLKVVGGFKTWGSMGEHTIEILACDDPTHCWIKVDGELRQPRTTRGVRAVLAEWIYRDGATQ